LRRKESATLKLTMSFGQAVEVFFRSLSIPIEVGFGFREGIGLSGPDPFGSFWGNAKKNN
jgi:hypothetical protein